MKSPSQASRFAGPAVAMRTAAHAVRTFPRDANRGRACSCRREGDSRSGGGRDRRHMAPPLSSPRCRARAAPGRRPQAFFLSVCGEQTCARTTRLPGRACTGAHRLHRVREAARRDDHRR